MTDEQISKNFTYHAPKEGQPEKYNTLRVSARDFAMTIQRLCPDSREKSLAFAKVEEAIMWANAAVARNE